MKIKEKLKGLKFNVLFSAGMTVFAIGLGLLLDLTDPFYKFIAAITYMAFGSSLMLISVKVLK